MSKASFSLSDYLMAFRDHEGMGFPEGKNGYRSHYPIADRIVCQDGFSMSVQASGGAYCSPRINIGPWDCVEVGYPSAEPEFIAQYAEDKDKLTDTVYPCVPVELVEKLIDLHGGPSDETVVAMTEARKQ